MIAFMVWCCYYCSYKQNQALYSKKNWWEKSSEELDNKKFERGEREREREWYRAGSAFWINISCMLLCSPFAKWIFEWMRNNVRVIVVYLCAQIILQKHNFSLQLFIGIICTRISHTIIMHAQCIQLWERCTLCTATPFLFSLVFGLFAHSCALAIHYVHFSMKKFYAMSMADKNYVDMYRACCISRSLARSLFLNGWRSLNRVLCFAFKFTTNLLHDSIFMVSKFSFCRLFFLCCALDLLHWGPLIASA